MAHKQAHTDRMLREDVAKMIQDARDNIGMWDDISDEELAKGIITVVRERVLREISTYARENIR